MRFCGGGAGFELSVGCFQMRGQLESGESADTPNQELTGPYATDLRVCIQTPDTSARQDAFGLSKVPAIGLCDRINRRRNGNPMNAASKLKTIASEKLTGVVYATSYRSDARTTICLYGDPTGLRSLACKLLQLADLDQSELDGKTCPNSEGVHVHLDPSMGIHLSSCPLIVGRSDAKGTGDDRWITGACDPAIDI
jgi:hypothetical protein